MTRRRESLRACLYRAAAGCLPACDTIRPMGFNPFRKQERRAADLVMVVGTVLVTAALVIWAFTGG